MPRKRSSNRQFTTSPSSRESHYNLGKLCSLQDNWVGRQGFQEAVRIDPGYVEAIAPLGFAQEEFGNNDAAVQTYRKAIALKWGAEWQFHSPCQLGLGSGTLVKKTSSKT